MKKFLNLSIIVAMLSMIMCTVSFSSCSKDDDDDTEIKKPEIFTVVMGDATSMKGSFLSVSKKNVYTTSQLAGNEADIEFGMVKGVILPASEASIPAMNDNKNKVTVDSENSYSFETAAFRGTIVVEKNTDGDYSVTVTRIAK